MIQSCLELFRIWLLAFRLVSQLQWQEPRNRMSDVTERTQSKTSCRCSHFGSKYKLDSRSHAGLFDILKPQIKLTSQTSRRSFCTERRQWPANIWGCSLVCVHEAYYSHSEREREVDDPQSSQKAGANETSHCNAPWEARTPDLEVNSLTL